MKVVIAGGSGALGRRVAADLTAAGHTVVILTRSRRANLAYPQVEWDGRSVGPWSDELAGAAVINLAGELVDRRPTPANIALLVRSRVQPTLALVEAAREHRPAVWLQASTLAIYGDAGDAILDESSPVAEGPPQMAGVATVWEQAASAAPVDRQVVLRTGIVLDRGTPALDRLVALTRWGLGGRVGSGQQWVSWLHVTDFLAVVRRCLTDPDLAGVLHVTSPEPVRNVELMAALRSVLGRPAAPPTPGFVVRLGAIVLRTDPALGLTGRRAVPRRLLDAGFGFAFPTLRPALEDLLG